jgi:hypothetical protein
VTFSSVSFRSWAKYASNANAEEMVTLLHTGHFQVDKP